MKDLMRKLGIIVLALIIGFAFVACTEDDDDKKPTTPTTLTNFKIKVGEDDVTVTAAASGSAVITYLANGYNMTLAATGDNIKDGHVISRFKLDLGGDLADFAKVTFTVTPKNADANYKRWYLLASEAEADVTGWKSDDAIKSKTVSLKSTGQFHEGNAPQSGTGATDITLTIEDDMSLTGELWFSFFAMFNAAGSSVDITNIKFISADSVGVNVGVEGIQIFGNGFARDSATGIITLDSAGNDNSGVIAIPVPAEVKASDKIKVTLSDVTITAPTAQFTVKVLATDKTISDVSNSNWYQTSILDTISGTGEKYPSVADGDITIDFTESSHAKDFIFLQHNNYQNATAKYSFKVIAVVSGDE